ncbi:Zinc knuckle [Geosmithia morbida]|uniref:Zinc knuckle n=1 Tax=Geosmithia morbida TaxID=1094350 RepID=A0A9P4YYL1_9HYPO|nr:Zinc knuckle [Geosmithia morbida]KAF4124177.1 Zinc knuckle [Geosmithia morbida]
MAPETPKGVSSRLLSMKFMQRAAASAASTPGSDSDASSAKKRKLGPDDDKFSANIDQASIQAAIDERESKRQAAIDKHGGNDTHWVLDADWGKKSKQPVKPPRRVVYVGYGGADSSDDEADTIDKPVRTSTKGYAKAKETKTCPEDESGSSDDESEDENRFKRSGREQSEHGRSRSRSGSIKQTAEASKAKEFRDKRKKKDVKLNKLTSISSAGSGNQFGSPNGNKSLNCFNCQKTGHKASDCPNKEFKSSSKRS